jgi:hypothetical protein
VAGSPSREFSPTRRGRSRPATPQGQERELARRRGDGSVAEAVIDQDGNGVIPAELLPARLPAGTRVHLEPARTRRRSDEGLLPDLPEITWEQFESGSRDAIRDAEVDQRPSCGWRSILALSSKAHNFGNAVASL